MRYTGEITIERSRNGFIIKLDDLENLKHWQKGLVSYRSISDTQVQKGAIMKLNYPMGKRSVVLVETIHKRNHPFGFHVTNDVKGVHNIQRN